MTINWVNDLQLSKDLGIAKMVYVVDISIVDKLVNARAAHHRRALNVIPTHKKLKLISNYPILTLYSIKLPTFLISHSIYTYPFA